MIEAAIEGGMRRCRRGWWLNVKRGWWEYLIVE